MVLIYIYVNIWIYVYTYIYTYIHIYIYIYIYIYIFIMAWSEYVGRSTMHYLRKMLYHKKCICQKWFMVQFPRILSQTNYSDSFNMHGNTFYWCRFVTRNNKYCMFLLNKFQYSKNIFRIPIFPFIYLCVKCLRILPKYVAVLDAHITWNKYTLWPNCSVCFTKSKYL